MDATALPDGLTALIKSTTRAAVAASVVPGATGPQRVEQMTGYSAGQISRFQRDAYPDLLPLAVVFLLEFTSQKPVFAQALAALTGHRLVPVEESETGPDFLSDLLSLTRSAASVQASYGAALADGTVTPREREHLKQVVASHMAELMEAERRLSAIAPCEPAPAPARRRR